MEAKRKLIRFLFPALAGGLLLPGMAKAVPSFARQTGMSCSVCHTVFPELTSFGRSFKMSGYTLGSIKKISETSEDKSTRLSLNETLPVGVMVMLTHSLEAQPDDATTVGQGTDGKGSIEFPAQFSLFYAGALSPQLGTFLQVTYDPGNGFLHFDNTDFRYADKLDLMGTDLVYGVDLNNNPTVQDVWNSVPAWGYPYATSDLTKKPTASALIDGGLSGQVASLGTYGYWNDLLYLEASLYRSATMGAVALPGVIQDFAPYWRAALQQDWDKHSAEIGAYGMVVRTLAPSVGNPLFAAGTVKGMPADQYTDLAADAQYQYNGDDHIVTAAATLISELQQYNGLGVVPYLAPPANPSDTLQTTRVTGTYYWRRTLGGSLSYFNTTGSTDAGLYGANLSPDQNGFVGELNYMAWLNTKFTLQYTYFNEYAGGSTNYDGAGRNARDNNTTMLMAWLMY
jgi:hypothetical protein